jgi:hypothetical protein
MKKSVVIFTVFLEAVLFLSIAGSGMANPIPIPTLIMPSENIDVSISPSAEGYNATVVGIYPFTNENCENVIMYFPIPSDADNVSVKMDENNIPWTSVDNIYPTVLGNLPMIAWEIAPVPDNFVITVSYEHSLTTDGENYTFLYAMGTGKYLNTYAKETTAYVNITMPIECGSINVYLDNEPTLFDRTTENNKVVISLTVVSEMFQPLTKDLILKFETDSDLDGMPDPWESQYGLDLNENDANGDKDGDGYTNFQEYQAGTNPNDVASYPVDSVDGINLMFIAAGIAGVAIMISVVFILKMK